MMQLNCFWIAFFYPDPLSSPVTLQWFLPPIPSLLLDSLKDNSTLMHDCPTPILLILLGSCFSHSTLVLGLQPVLDHIAILLLSLPSHHLFHFVVVVVTGAVSSTTLPYYNACQPPGWYCLEPTWFTMNFMLVTFPCFKPICIYIILLYNWWIWWYIQLHQRTWRISGIEI